jgi:hypothetical protein
MELRDLGKDGTVERSSLFGASGEREARRGGIGSTSIIFAPTSFSYSAFCVYLYVGLASMIYFLCFGQKDDSIDVCRLRDVLFP